MAKTPGPTQERLPEVAEEITEIEAAAREYVIVRDARMGWTKKEVAAQAVLVTAMKDAKRDRYTTVGGLSCELTTKEKVKVRTKTEEDDGDGGDVE